MLISRPNSTSRPRGFALLVTIVLVAFLVLILVGLATFTRVETQVSSNSQQIAAARQQALMALNIAVGKLQENAGQDARVTTTAEAALTTPAAGARHWTGVWTSAGAGASPDRGWLVSGISPNAASFSGTIATQPSLSDTSVTLVGANSLAADPASPTAAEQAEYITVPLQNVTSNGIPGLADTPGGHRIGRFAWWVGDEGVKASMALPDRLSEVTYAPYDTATARRILRTQVPMGPQDFVGTGGAGDFGFDPQNVGSAAVRKVIDLPQFDFLTPFGPATDWPADRRGKFHDWTTVASGVLANTRTDATRGLKRDLSLNPSLLGNAYQAWADYPSHVETPAAGNSAYPAITSADDARRRHRVAVPVTSAGSDPVPLVHRVAPLLAELHLLFRPSDGDGSTAVRVNAGAVVSLWNPHSAGLVPEDLWLELSGLPTVTFDWGGGVTLAVDLNAGYLTSSGGTQGLVFRIPATGGSAADQEGVEPHAGRMVSWRTAGPTESFVLGRVNRRNLSGVSGSWTLNRTTTSNTPAAVRPGWTVPAATLTARLRRGSATGAVLWEAPLPAYQADAVPVGQTINALYYAYRITQPLTNNDTWLTTTGQDPRSPTTSAIVHTPYKGAGNDIPSFASGGSANFDTVVGSVGTLINRGPPATTVAWSATRTNTYNNNVPLFELPRLPVLSLGQLQHMMVEGQRPFAVGNSWGGYGSLWDRFYHSGIPLATTAGYPEPNLSAGQPFPFVHLAPLGDTSLAAYRAAPAVAARRVLMNGAFNINSPRESAWRAILQSLRPSAPADWHQVDLTEATGTATSSGGVTATFVRTVADRTRGNVGNVASRASGFARFPQTAHENFIHDPTSSTARPAFTDPVNNTGQTFDTLRYRAGIRAGDDETNTNALGRNLTRTQLATLAAQITDKIKTRVAASGPFRSMEDFLNAPSAGALSLLEQAIADANLNTNVGGFSSLWLSQADILTALGPQLQNRSDTFVIRAYGESVNPVTASIDSRAWLEARVQRIPEPLDAADASDPTGARVAQPQGAFGRRFQIVSLRWLSPADL